jgi:hypothetical protein
MGVCGAGAGRASIRRGLHGQAQRRAAIRHPQRRPDRCVGCVSDLIMCLIEAWFVACQMDKKLRRASCVIANAVFFFLVVRQAPLCGA